MKLSVLTFAVATTATSSFVLHPSPAIRSKALHEKSDAEAHMEVMPKIWDELKKTERDIVVKHHVDETNEDEFVKAMTERMLETALDYVQTKEQIEEADAFAAHKAYQQAVEEEEVLEEFIEADHLNDIPLDSFVEKRLHSAQQLELDALKEEEDHLKQLDELHKAEESVRAALEELKKQKP